MSERLTDERLSEIRASVLHRAMRPYEFHEPTEALALLAEIDRLRGERQWLPIETAPKMRKIIVSYLNALGKRRCVMACYYKAHSLEMHDDYADVGENDEVSGESFAPEGWYEEHDQDSPLMRLQEEPTHWMPIPAAPDATVPPRPQEATGLSVHHSIVAPKRHEDPTCEHGRAWDVHCCGCHSGFLFDIASCTCLGDHTTRQQGEERKP